MTESCHILQEVYSLHVFELQGRVLQRLQSPEWML